MPDHDPDVLREQPCGGHSFHDDNGITGLDWSLSEVVFRQFPTGRFQNCCTAAALSKQGEGPVLMTRQYRRPPSLGHPLSYFPHHRFIAQAHRTALFLYNKQRYCIPEPQKCKHAEVKS
jgi:hypothetical protein